MALGTVISRHHGASNVLVAAAGVIGLTAGVVALTLVVAGATASAPALTATAVQITDQPAYVQAVVAFSGPALASDQVQATDPDPSNGTARLLVSVPGTRTRVPVRSANQVTVRLVTVPSGLRVDLGSARGAFKYISYRLSVGNALTIELWKRTFAPAGNVTRGLGGCLTLGHVSVGPGTVTASGTARGLFENQFRAVLRNWAGEPLASRRVVTLGHWKATLHYTAPQGQGGSFEAAAASAKDGALGCLVQKDVVLPASNRRANLSVVYRAGADVNGDGRLDLVTLRHFTFIKGLLTVALAGDGRLSVPTSAGATWLPGLVASGNVDGRAGEELFVDVTHVTTAESISIYTYWHGDLVKAGTLWAYGYDYGILSGLTCSAQGTRRFITEHDFYIKFDTHRWMRQDTVYVWQGPTLRLFARRAATRMRGAPSPALVGVQCGHLPVLTAASPSRTHGAAAALPPGGPVPAGAAVASVSFVSSGTPFVLGSAPCTHAACTVMLRTLDRGRTWRSLAAPAEAISVPDGKGLWGLRFADTRRGYAYGAELWQTNNGAASWQPMKVPGRTVLAFAAVQDRELVAAMTACRSVGCPKGVALYHRPIGAGRWTRFAANTSKGTAFDTAIAVHRNVVWILTGYELYVSTDGVAASAGTTNPAVPRTAGRGSRPRMGSPTTARTPICCASALDTPAESRSTSTGPPAPDQPGPVSVSRRLPAAQQDSPPPATRRS